MRRLEHTHGIDRMVMLGTFYYHLKVSIFAQVVLPKDTSSVIRPASTDVEDPDLPREDGE